MAILNLKNHPFAVEAFFETSIVLTFAIPKKQLESLIPECLELDTFDDQWAFFAIAMVETKNLRPKGFPIYLGNDFFLIGYRIFVKYKNQAGKRLRGLYIIKSETNKKRMAIMGNLFTHYNYTTTDIQQTKNYNRTNVVSKKSKFNFEFSNDTIEIELPKGSPFSSWKEARRFAGPLPFTFTYNATNKEVLIIEGVRKDWNPQPLKLINYHFDFLQQNKFKGQLLANAFIIETIPYQWKKGKLESWN
ncbi:DUF2071 domain-containing protein [Aestuariibaculum sediminum]|uniref:DUF2071 domain-containing protein n=1 Tax=Aestuariibaculum sediminum TaxID=2770637 RepID=A0A8J6UBG1_9FLAO|nr:DUF2071 domain-containing protein [Aestuariibaculum sediminum]MBD0830729.1 DUF2071 domain-containing protein [Aestuariibaculum sediminum]